MSNIKSSVGKLVIHCHPKRHETRYSKAKPAHVNKELVLFSGKRSGESGAILISTLISAVILLGVVITVQAQMQAQALTIATLIKSEEQILHQRAIKELAGADIAQAILSSETSSQRSLSGEPYQINFEGQTFEVKLQDIAGLVDIYQSGSDQLTLLGLDTSEVQSILNWRQSAAGINRLSNLDQAMEILDINQNLKHLLTQRRQSNRINPNSAPIEIRDRVNQLPRTSLRIEQAKIVRVEVISSQ